MSVSELIKTALPVAATQSDAASMGTPTKYCSNNNSGTPQKLKNQPTAVTNTDKVENVPPTPITTAAAAASSTILSTNSNALTTSKGKIMQKTAEEFNKDLQLFHEKRGTPIAYMPKISGRLVDLLGLYNEVTERGGFHKVNTRDEWDEVLPVVGLRDKCVNASAAVKHIYRRFLEKYERLTFFGEDPDKMEAMEAADALESGRSRSSRYPSMHGVSSNINAVPMSYNYRQHIVNMDRRRTFRLSTDLHKHSNYEKLMLSLISPLPNEQDFAINVCTLMADESKLTLKLSEYPKLLNVLLAHAGVFADCTLRQLFQQTYARVRKNSLYGFWRDLLHDKPLILELYTDEEALRNAGLIMDIDDTDLNSEREKKITEYLNMDFFNLGRGRGTQDVVGQRVKQIINILRNLSFFEEHLSIFSKNRTLLRFMVMSANVRWGTLHIQALDIIGNIAMELDLMDPSLDNLSRYLMGTLCDGIEGEDRAVIINCLEILYKLCQKESNEDYINKCLNLKFYETICLFLSLNDIMLLIFTLEAIYALTSMGARSCHIIMQVRGILDQLVSLISVEAQAYGPDGCILMRVVETVPGNMLPMVAQNIANLQNVQQQQQPILTPQSNNNNNKSKIQQPTASVVPPPQQQQQALPKLSQSTAAAAAIILQQQTQILQQPLSQTNQATLQQHQQSHISTTSINNNEQQKVTNLQQQQQPPPAPPIKPTLPTINSQLLQQQQPLVIPKSQSPAPAPIINQPITITTTNTPTLVTSTTTLSTSTNQFTQDDEQYALAWLGATFERAAGIESRIEQQDLYRMYLTHSQKAGKHSVVNHMQFPKLVRIIFGHNIGPAIVRRADGTEYSGIHYVAIKMRAQPLPIQIKMNQTIPTTTTPSITQQQQQLQQNVIKTTPELKKVRKKLLQQSNSFEDINTNNNTIVATTTTTPIIIRSSESSITSTINSVATNTVTTDVRPTHILTSTSIKNNNNNNLITTTTTMTPPTTSTTKPIITSNIQLSPAISMQQQQQQPPPPPLQQHQQQYQLQQQPSSSSSLIKSLLANKVNQRQQKQKEQIITQTTGIINQQQQQQKPIKVTSNSISALVNNPLMQNTPVKVGQTTIKPLNPQLAQIDKKQQQQQHNTIMESSVPPPLAPLSGNNVVKDTCGRSMIIANQMLVDILDKKTSEPPIPTTIIKRKMMDDGDTNNSSSGGGGGSSAAGGQTIKRLAYDANGSVIAVVASSGGNNNSGGGCASNQMTPSKNAANFYAEMAASILEDEELEDIPTLLTHSGNNNNSNNNKNTSIPTVPPAPAQAQIAPQLQHQQSAMLSIAGDISNNQVQQLHQQQQQQQSQQIYLPAKIQQNMSRQLLFQTNPNTQQQQQQLKLTGQPTAMATIKTDQGLQTVPVILQQKSLDPSQPQYLIQQQQQQQATHTTQYVLATNQQGQTYLVAQQIPTQPPPPQQQAPTQTMLLAQTPQHGAGTKTIIIVQQQQQQLQQQSHHSGHLQQQQQQQQQQQPQSTQKMIMTTQQGQQVLLTQRTPATTPTPPPPSPSPSTPIIINPGTGVNTILQRQFQQQQQQQQQQLQQHQSSSGQISPTLLSQLNHIPATIKLHQPSVICSTNSVNNMANSQTTATITRVAKPLTAMPMQIPQLQQHSSIIQQHIISGGGCGGVGGGGGGTTNICGDKRQVILSGGRAIEIKETVIANNSSVQPHAQSALLNSQTIITHSPRTSNVMESTTTTTAVTTTTTTAAVVASTTPSIVQQKISSFTTNVAVSGVQTKPTIGVSTSAQSTTTAQVTQSPMVKKTAVIAHRPLSTSVIKNNTTILQGGVIGNSGGGNGIGPPPLAVHSSKVQTVQGQDKLEDMPKTPALTKTPTPPLPGRAPTPATTISNINTITTANNLQQQQQQTPPPPPLNNVDINWPYVCDWRNCPRRKFKSLNDLQQHACTVHCPEHLDPAAEIFCQWGTGPGLCDGIPRKRYSLMTHLIDRHITMDVLRQAVQRRINAGASNLLQSTQPPVTIIRNMSDTQRCNTASPALSSSSSAASSNSMPATGSSALQAIQRHTVDFINSKELMDENEGPVTKSIRLTAALILRNLVTYTNPAKRSLRRYEQHLSNIALSNVECSGTLSHILYELNN